MLKRWYVTATWHDWPEGGTYGTITQAESYEGAVQACHWEMADSLSDANGVTSQENIETHGDDWRVVDCFDLDAFIAQHGPAPALPPLVVEYHYDDGDVGAHPVSPADEATAALWRAFALGGAPHPAQLVIRPATPDEREG